MKQLFKLPAYVGIILKKDNKMLLVRRHATDWAAGQWNFPGGLLEEGETLMQAAIRETAEETGALVAPENFKLVHVLQVHANAHNTKDIIGFYFMAQTWQGEVYNKEPHRHSEIGWFSLRDMPENLTEHARQAIKGMETSTMYSENK